MAEGGAVLPGSLRPECFFGRVEELARLRREARALVRGRGRSRALCARAGSGKTELLRQWHGRLFEEGEILPLWYALPRDCRDRAGIAADLVAQFSLQALAFKRRDPEQLLRPLPRGELAERLRTAWAEGGPLLAEAAAGLDAAPAGRDPLAWAALVPHRLAARTGTPVLLLLDDADGLASPDAASSWPSEAAASAIAPVLFAFDDESGLSRLFGSRAASLVTLERLGRLSPEASARLARHLARTSGLALEEASIAALVDEAAGSPFYLGALVRALAELPASGPEAVARAAAAAVSDGELARYWVERIAEAIPERRVRATALELLAFCLREGDEAPDAGRLASLMLKPEGEVDAALAALCRAGVVRLDSSRIVVDADPVFRDAVAALYRREHGRAAPAFVAAALAAEKIGRVPEAARGRRRRALRDALCALLERWDGQRVPAALFDVGRGGASRAGEAGSTEDLVTLPRVIAATSGRVGSGSPPLGLEVDALAWALRPAPQAPGADLAWVVRNLPGGEGSDTQLERFDREVAALQAAGDLPGVRLVRWAILDEAPDEAGRRSASRLRISTSTGAQLEALAALLEVPLSFPPPLSEPAPAPALELEMVIPRAADVELVAARALEQLAENLEIDAAATGRLKMALVEACINAFEHGGRGDGRVRLVFTAGSGRLVIRVENRGRPLAALPPAAAAGRESRGRGWGLTLIRELVDEVSLEPRDDGVSLLMVKRLGEGGA